MSECLGDQPGPHSNCLYSTPQGYWAGLMFSWDEIEGELTPQTSQHSLTNKINKELLQQVLVKIN